MKKLLLSLCLLSFNYSFAQNTPSKNILIDVPADLLGLINGLITSLQNEFSSKFEIKVDFGTTAEENMNATIQALNYAAPIANQIKANLIFRITPIGEKFYIPEAADSFNTGLIDYKYAPRRQDPSEGWNTTFIVKTSLVWPITRLEFPPEELSRMVSAGVLPLDDRGPIVDTLYHGLRNAIEKFVEPIIRKNMDRASWSETFPEVYVMAQKIYHTKKDNQVGLLFLKAGYLENLIDSPLIDHMMAHSVHYLAGNGSSPSVELGFSRTFGKEKAFGMKVALFGHNPAFKQPVIQLANKVLTFEDNHGEGAFSQSIGASYTDAAIGFNAVAFLTNVEGKLGGHISLEQEIPWAKKPTYLTIDYAFNESNKKINKIFFGLPSPIDEKVEEAILIAIRRQYNEILSYTFYISRERGSYDPIRNIHFFATEKVDQIDGVGVSLAITGSSRIQTFIAAELSRRTKDDQHLDSVNFMFSASVDIGDPSRAAKRLAEKEKKHVAMKFEQLADLNEAFENLQSIHRSYFMDVKFKMNHVDFTTIEYACAREFVKKLYYNNNRKFRALLHSKDELQQLEVLKLFEVDCGEQNHRELLMSDSD